MRCACAVGGADTSSRRCACGLLLALALWLALSGAAQGAETQPATTRSAAKVAVTVGPANKPATRSLESTEIRVRASVEKSQGAATRSKSGTTGFGFWRVSAALGIVLGSIFVLRWAGKRFLNLPIPGTSGGAVKVLSRSTISPRQQLMLIQVGRRVVLVGNCGSQMNALCEIDEPEEVAELIGMVGSRRAESPVSSAFSSLFGRIEHSFDAEERHEAPEVRHPEPVDPELATTREEVAGLLDKVRGLAKQFKRV